MGGLKIKKGDKVEVLAGKYRGKQGKVLKSFPESRRVVVEGVNLVKRHTRPSQENPQGGIVTKERLLRLEGVSLVAELPLFSRLDPPPVRSSADSRS